MFRSLWDIFLCLTTHYHFYRRSITSNLNITTSGVDVSAATDTAALAQAKDAGAHQLSAQETAPPAAATTNDLQAVFADMLRAAEFVDNPEQLMAHIESMAWEPSAKAGMPIKERRAHPAFTAFVSAWQDVALDPNRLASMGSAAPFALLFASCKPEFKTAIKDSIMPVLVRHLTQQRGYSASERAEFFLHAEAFAGMACVGIVPMEPAVQSMIKLVQQPKSRLAALTCLGKMIELAGSKLKETVPPDALRSLQDILATINDEEFKYDVDYIQESMGWKKTSAATDASQTPPPDVGLIGAHPNGSAQFSTSNLASTPIKASFRAQTSLKPVASLAGHTSLIMSLAYDQARRAVFSSGRNAELLVWSEDGRHLQRIDTHGWAFNSMDVHPSFERLLAVGQKGPSGPYCLAVVHPSGATSDRWTCTEPLVRNVAAAAVRCLPGTTGFLTAESMAVGDGTLRHVVQYWDTGSFASNHASSLPSPLTSFMGHPDPVTALDVLSERGPGAFASGGKRGRVLLWDLRTAASVASVGNLEAKDGFVTPPAAGSIITTLASADNLLLVGSADRALRVFDLRRLAQGTADAAAPLATLQMNNEVVVRATVAPGALAAVVSCIPNLFAVDLAVDMPTLTQLDVQWPEGRSSPGYLDMRWNAEGTLLFAGGQSNTLDILSV
jgi:WD40 repeat protein